MLSLPLVTSHDHFAARWQQYGQLTVIVNFRSFSVICSVSKLCRAVLLL